MKRTIGIGFALLAAIVIGFCAIAALQPSELRVERSTLISAPPAVVFAQVNDLHRWQKFSPWAKRDPEAKNTFEGPNDVAFTFTPQGEQTRVVWSMTGENDFMGKAIGLLMKMDAMIGGDFEQGLADLKAIAEAATGR